MELVGKSWLNERRSDVISGSRGGSSSKSFSFSWLGQTLMTDDS